MHRPEPMVHALGLKSFPFENEEVVVSKRSLSQTNQQWSYDSITKKLDNRASFGEFEDETQYPIILPSESNQGYIEFDVSPQLWSCSEDPDSSCSITDRNERGPFKLESKFHEDDIQNKDSDWTPDPDFMWRFTLSGKGNEF